MRERIEPIPIPENARYFAADLGERGKHHMRLPDFQAIEALSTLVRRPDVDLGTDLGTYIYAGAAIGLCWYHRGYELETPEPATLGADALYAYSRAVNSELFEAGYDQGHVIRMAYAIMARISEQRGLRRKAAEVLGNGAAAEKPQPSTST